MAAALILQLRSDPPTIMGIASCGIVSQAPVSPSEQQFSRRRLQEDSAGEQMADRWNGDAELRRAIRESASARPGLLLFRLPSDAPRPCELSATLSRDGVGVGLLPSLQATSNHLTAISLETRGLPSTRSMLACSRMRAPARTVEAASGPSTIPAITTDNLESGTSSMQAPSKTGWAGATPPAAPHNRSLRPAPRQAARRHEHRHCSPPLERRASR